MPVRPVLRTALRCVLVLLFANLAFLLIRFATTAIDKDVVRSALRIGFANGAITTESYPHTVFGGYDQASDCIVGQIAAIGAGTWVRDAVVPHIVSPSLVGPNYHVDDFNTCQELHDFVDGTLDKVPIATYARFWHGAASAFSAGLLGMPVDGYRGLLLMLTLGLIALVAILAALRSRGLLVALSPFLSVVFLFDGQISYGHHISYGPAAIAAWLIALLTIAFSHRLTPGRLIVLAVLGGALEAFFDMIISVPLNASIFLIVACSCSAPRWAAAPVWTAIRDTACYAAAWFFGFGGTFLIKLGLSMTVLGWEPLMDFLQQLAFRAGTIDPQIGLQAEQPLSRGLVVASILLRLLIDCWRLGYAGQVRSPPTSILIAAITVIGWIAAGAYLVMTSMRGNGRLAFVAAIGYPAAAGLFLAWVAIFPEHTVRHPFMVRSAIVWMIGGWGILFAAGYAEALARDTVDHRGEKVTGP